MSLWSRIFTSTERKGPSNKIVVFLNTDFKQSIEVDDQPVGRYLESAGGQGKEYIFLLVKNKKDSILLKRKLNRYEKFSQVLASVDPDCRGFFVMGYNTHFRNEVERSVTVMSNVENQGAKIIRSGILYKFSHRLGIFEECQFKLHQDYLMYSKISKRDKLSLIPLENSSVQLIDQNKCIFSIQDKFKTIKLKSLSKEDMNGWLLSITDAIKIKNEQRYVNGLTNRVVRHQQDKMRQYSQQAKHLLESDRALLTDEKGRKALRDFFQKHPKKSELALDIQLLAVLNKFYHYCRLLRDQDNEAKQTLEALRGDLGELKEQLSTVIALPANFDVASMQSNELYKLLEQLSTYLSQKYHPQLLSGKQLHASILKTAVQNYREQHRLHLSSLLNRLERN